MSTTLAAPATETAALHGGSRLVIVAAICGNLALAATKLLAATVTHSSAMLAEGIHSSIDTGNGLLLLWGLRQSRKPADRMHPFGHGLELYFWSFVVAVMIFGVGGGLSLYEGVQHLLNPRPMQHIVWNYVVLGCGFVFEGISLHFALREFLRIKGEQSVWEAIHTAKDPTLFAVLLEDSAAILGLTVALLAITFGLLFENPYFDGAASIVIGLLLMGVAWILAYESRSLLIGESAPPAVEKSILSIVTGDPAVERSRRPLTMQLGPYEILVNLDVQFRPSLTAVEIQEAVQRLERNIRQRHPEAKRIFLETQSLADTSGTFAPR
jgi:cation diffusion facilitator family transporter